MNFLFLFLGTYERGDYLDPVTLISHSPCQLEGVYTNATERRIELTGYEADVEPHLS
jgi:hypothetical protein